jgi:hypothetical protein
LVVDRTRAEVTPVFAWELDLILFSLFTTLALVGAGTVRAALEEVGGGGVEHVVDTGFYFRVGEGECSSNTSFSPKITLLMAIICVLRAIICV